MPLNNVYALYNPPIPSLKVIKYLRYVIINKTLVHPNGYKYNVGLIDEKLSLQYNFIQNGKRTPFIDLNSSLIIKSIPQKMHATQHYFDKSIGQKNRKTIVIDSGFCVFLTEQMAAIASDCFDTDCYLKLAVTGLQIYAKGDRGSGYEGAHFALARSLVLPPKQEILDLMLDRHRNIYSHWLADPDNAGSKLGKVKVQTAVDIKL